jgi:hypothetical protein
MNYEIICYICYRYSKIYDDICSKNVYIYIHTYVHIQTHSYYTKNMTYIQWWTAIQINMPHDPIQTWDPNSRPTLRGSFVFAEL